MGITAIVVIYCVFSYCFVGFCLWDSYRYDGNKENIKWWIISPIMLALTIIAKLLGKM